METPVNFPSWPARPADAELPGGAGNSAQARPLPIPPCWAVAVIEYLPPARGILPESLLTGKAPPVAARSAPETAPVRPAASDTGISGLYHPASGSLPTMLFPGATVLIPFRLAQLEDTISRVKLRQLFGWLEAQRDLATDHYSELWQIRDFSLFYATIKDMALKEMRLLKAYRSGWKQVHASSLYSATELHELEICYARILLAAMAAIDELLELTGNLSTPSVGPVSLPPLRLTVERIEALHSELLCLNEQMAALNRRRFKALCTAQSP